MGLFGKKNNGGFMDVIRCDEPSYLVWKWHTAGSQEGEFKRENEIRWGSSLRVKDGEVAIFVYKQKDGKMQDYIEGPFDETIKTKNLPVLVSLLGLLYDGNSPFQAEIYFVNLAKIIQVRFGIPYFDIYDPRLPDFGVPVAVRGTISFQIRDYREFVKLHRLSTFRLEDFQNQIKDVIIRYVKDIVTNTSATNNIPLIQIETKTAIINDTIEQNLRDRLQEDFGVIITGVDIGAIEIDKSSEGFQRLMEVTRDVDAGIIEARKEADIKNIYDMQRINVENVEDALKRQREEGQYAQHKQTQTYNLNAFQIEKQAEVGIASAEALGHMGENGATRMDIGVGSSGSGIDVAGMVTGMALGGAVGQNMAGMLNGVLGGMNQQTNTISPPPIPQNKYNVVIEGKSVGPFDLQAIKTMMETGQINTDTLVWCAGMSEWTKAGKVNELKNMSIQMTPPSIPE